MDRFSPPTAADEMAYCTVCRNKFHYEMLDKQSRCYQGCSEFDSQEEEDERKVEDET